ncbi:MAG: hypothetical protein GJ676_03505 [Rhodobacteraceae bacterium]|nr:hypothetical protein [Paracoccaceae bacterium]
MVFCLYPAAVSAQDPLSVIEWLTPETHEALLPDTVLLEPPVSGSIESPDIQVTPLEALLPPLGLVPASSTGLPIDLWRGSSARILTRLIERVPVRDYPALQSLLYTVLLSETRPPAGKDAAQILTLARLDRLMQLGATDPAQALVQLADPTGDKDRFLRWFDATLLTGDEDRSCAALIAKPYLAPDDRGRIFCLARRGDWETAALLLETAHALELMPREDLALLDRFLSPEIFEGAPPLPRPKDPDPLTFRLFEAIGERLPTTPLPRAFATADLRDVAGWKAQIEAAERLTRIGALNPNHLLGLYTERRPAASGGVWDRVQSLQRFDTALQSGSAEAVAKTLPTVWRNMQDVGLEVAFADLFSDQLAALDLPPPAASLAWRIRLLSPSYEAAANTPPEQSDGFLIGLARGTPSISLARAPRERAIAEGFLTDAPIPAELEVMLSNGQLGEVILRTIELFARGADGNLQDLTESLTVFRRVGLEDTARRASLQLLLLERS